MGGDSDTTGAEELACSTGERVDRKHDGARNGNPFKLADFYPYHARIFYKAVTDSVSQIYVSAYNVKAYEWRILAILGEYQGLSPLDIVELSSMDKVSVCRAVSALGKRGSFDL